MICALQISVLYIVICLSSFFSVFSLLSCLEKCYRPIIYYFTAFFLALHTGFNWVGVMYFCAPIRIQHLNQNIVMTFIMERISCVNTELLKRIYTHCCFCTLCKNSFFSLYQSVWVQVCFVC